MVSHAKQFSNVDSPASCLNVVRDLNVLMYAQTSTTVVQYLAFESGWYLCALIAAPIKCVSVTQSWDTWGQ